MPGQRRPARDPGLQPERTALAWQRTGIASSAVSSVALLAAAHDGSPVLLAVVAVLAACGAGFGAAAARRPVPDGSSPWVRMLYATATALVLAATGLVLVAAAVAG